MSIQKIDYEDKIGLQNDPNVPDKNKVLDDDMNEIKETVNNNADELTTAQQNIENLQTGQGTASTDITSLKNRVTALETDNTTNKQDINTLKTDNETNKQNIANKVDKVEGKGLSTEDYTTGEKQKLAGLNNYDDTAIKKDIANIKEEQTAQNKKIQELDDNQIHITTEKASNINVKDCSGQNGKIKLLGISKQETRSGKNKFDIDDLINVTEQNAQAGSFIASGLYGTTIINNINLVNLLKPNTNYKCIANVTLLGKPATITSNIANMLTLYKSIAPANNIPVLKCSNSTEKNNWQVNETKQLETVFTTDNDLNLYNMLCYCYANDTEAGGKFKFENIMILEATEQDETFEPYGASPSPEFPSEIENAGDNINYFDISKITSGSIVINNNDGTLIIKNNPNTNGYVQQTKKLSELCPDLKVGDIATLGFKTTTKNSSYANSIYVGEAWNNGTYKTITQSMLDFQVGFYGGYNEISTISDIKIEKGTKVTPFSEYGCGNIDITDCNKNLFDKNKITDNNYLNENGGLTSNTLYCVSDFINVAENETYFLKTRGTSRTKFYDKNKQALTKMWDVVDGDKNFVIPSNAKYIRFSINKETVDINTFQFERNSIETEYIEHKEQLITFPFQENQKMFKGSETKDDGIHHKRKQIVLDGTENWQVINENVFYLTLNDIKISSSALMTHFKYTSKILTNLLDNEFTTRAGTGNSIWIKKEGMTLETFKSFLAQQKTAGTPVIAEYETEEETIEAYTEEQQTAYNQLQNAKTYKTVTNVFTENAEVEMEYIAHTKSYVDNEINSIKEQINTINQLLSTTNTSALLLDNLQTDLESEVL